MMKKPEKSGTKAAADRPEAGRALSFCNFISLMLITAYSGMMFSPTVQTILPDGGDSRKQMYAILCWRSLAA